jgi:hypothetical protein
MNTTYSFLDSVATLVHPVLPIPITISGEGMGSATVAMTTERTTHNVASDGVVMVSKIAGNNGSITIEVQQTSAAHKALLAFFNLLIVSPPNVWAQAVLLLRNVTDGTSHLATGLSPAKIPDKKYDKEGGMVAWHFMAADIQSVTI